MTIYEVRIEVEPAAAADFLAWLREHMQAIVEVAGFERAELFTLEAEVPTWVVKYVASSRKTIEDYLNVHAKSFRADSAARFGNVTKIERRILNFQERFPA